MKHIAIIGSNGMLGSDLVRYLKKLFVVTAITKENYSKYSGKSFDVLINANGNSKRFWANANPLEDFQASTTSVYNTLFDFRYAIYIYISSSDVYANHTEPRYTKENSLVSTDKLSPYGLHKYFSELLVKKYAEKYLILRSAMMLGQNLRKGPIFDILQNKPLFITKSSKLQMITTQEIANIISFLLARKSFRQVYNMGGTDKISLGAIKKIIHTSFTCSAEAEKQVYEMSVVKLKKIFRLKTSEKYLQDFIQTLT